LVDPRRTVTVNACEVEAGKDNVLHLAINPGTDLALLNALLTYVADKDWIDKSFIEQHTSGYEKMLKANRTSVDEAAKITGLDVKQIERAASFIGRAQRRQAAATMFCYEKA